MSGGALRIPAATGDLYQGNNTAANLVLRDPPAAVLDGDREDQLRGRRPVPAGRASSSTATTTNYVKLGRIAHTTAGDEKFEFIHETDAVADNTGADSHREHRGGLPGRLLGAAALRRDEPDRLVLGERDQLHAGRTRLAAAGRRAGSACSPSATPRRPLRRRPRSTRSGSPGPARRPGRAATTSSTARPSTRRAGTRSCATRPRPTRCRASNLTITTQPGDIYSGDTNPPPNNFILQSADHAGADWVIETKIDSRVDGGYGQGGLIAYLNGDNYVKLDPIADAGQTRINRIELRTEIAGTPTGPADRPADRGRHRHDLLPAPDQERDELHGRVLARRHDVAAGRHGARTRWPNPQFGVFAFGPQADGQGDTVAFDYFLLDGRDAGEPCDCVARPRRRVRRRGAGQDEVEPRSSASRRTCTRSRTAGSR